MVLGPWTLNLPLAVTTAAERPDCFLTAELQWPVLLFTLGLSVAAGLVFGLHPVWQASRVPVAGALKDDAGSVSMSYGSVRARKALVGMQVAISALLLVPTGLFLKSLVNLTRVDLGMNTRNVITFRLSPRLNGYSPEQTRALFERVEERMAAIPGVSSVAASMVPLIAGSNWGNNLTVEGYARGPTADRDTHSMLSQVGPGFFGKMGIPLIMGREFTERDNLAAPKVAVVNEQFARHFFGGANPLGRRFCPGWGKVTPDIEIVGVIKNSHYAGVKQEIPRVYYTPWRQDKRPDSLSFYVRTVLDPAQIIPQMRREMASIDGDLPLQGLRTFEEQIRQNTRGDQLMLQLAASFAILATFMAMLGLYGGMVFRELLVILGAGLAAGIPAGYFPARRATRVNPIDALRYE